MATRGTVDPADAVFVDRRPRWRRSRAVRAGVIFAVVMTFLIGGLFLRRHNQDDYQHTMIRAQLEAQVVGEAIDPSSYLAAWAAQGGNVPPGDDTVTPQIPAARVYTSFVTERPLQIGVAYSVERGGFSGCVRLNRTDAGSTVTARDLACGADEGSA